MEYLVLTATLFLLRFALANRAGARKQIYWVVIFGLFVFSAFRYQVGCDWFGYFNQYVKSENYDWANLLSIREPIWWASLQWVNLSGFPYPVINVISSAVFFAGIHILARRQPDPLGFLVLLFPILIINMPMTAMRQGAAIGLICIAFCAFIDRRPGKYALWVLLAAGFHSSAIVWILLLPWLITPSRWSGLILPGLMTVPMVYLLALSEKFQIATFRYVDTGVDSGGAIFRTGILFLSGLYFLSFLRRKWRAAYPREYVLTFLGAVAMTGAIFLVPISTVIADRLGYYLIPIQMMIFARLPFLRFNRFASLHQGMPYIGMLLIFATWSQLSWHFQECYVPYQTWIFGFPGGDSVGL